MDGNPAATSGQVPSHSHKEEPQSPPSDTLRRRRKSTRQLSYKIANPTSYKQKLSHAQESVFLNMYLRKMHRRIRGKQSNDSLCCEFIVVVILVVVITVLGRDDAPSTDDHTALLVAFVLWIAFGLGIFFVFKESPYIKMLRYMLFYVPLLYFVTYMSFHKEMEDSDTLYAVEYALGVLFIIVEALVFIGFMSYYKILPRFLHSDWLRKRPGLVQKIWNVESVVEGDVWTMSYREFNLMKCKMNYMCKYEGGIDESTGLPDGLGRWLDDCYDGEMLTGYFKQGQPVAPFSSWTVGTAEDAVVAVRVGYFKATDDSFSKNKFFPTNDQNPECGVACIECSISGSFYKHLPSATLIEGPFVAESMPNAHTNPVREMLSHVIQLCDEDQSTGQIDIRSDALGVYIPGYVYGPTGRYHSPDTLSSIVIDVEWGNGENIIGGSITSYASRRASARTLQKSLFMPPNAKSHRLSTVVEVEVDDSSIEDGEHVDESECMAEQRENNAQRTATMSVKNWIPAKYKEALIFFPGYNFTMETALKNFGQFLAMTKLSGQVYPIMFVWPGSKNVGYKYASQISASNINEENVLKLVTGLKQSGIDRIHFLTHSMGIQSLMHAFRDTVDEEGNFVSRSRLSKCFTLDPGFDYSKGPKEGKREQFQNKLICKSITFLNPDFPIQSFVDRGFLSIRRICSTVTVVGDVNDRALGFSSFINGAVPYYFGYQQPEALKPTLTPNTPPKLEFMKRIGRSIKDLYFPDDAVRKYIDNGRKDEFSRLLFNKSASIDFSRKEKGEHYWLDVDVIDMTGLDTNIKGQRHSGFSYNGMLLKDLQELFSTGKRAMKRSSLLFRGGNNFTFAFAPSFVVQ